jgi:hypothetical protein
MELLISIAVAVVLLVVFDLAAARFGVDSRDGFSHDRGTPAPHWF